MLSYCVERLSKSVQSTITVHGVLLFDLRHWFLACFQKLMWISSQMWTLFVARCFPEKCMIKYSYGKSIAAALN